MKGIASHAQPRGRTAQQFGSADDCHLQKPEVADCIANALRPFGQQRYRFFAWCVMPNHVHVGATKTA